MAVGRENAQLAIGGAMLSDRCRIGIARFSLAMAASFACSGAHAASMSFKCEERDGDKRTPITIVYDGDAEGTLKVSAPFGDVSLPAKKKSAEGQTGVSGIGAAKILMPDKAAIEKCISSKADPSDQDMQAIALISCKASTPLAADPIDVTVDVRMLLMDGVVMAELRRTYAEKSALMGGILTLEAFPPMGCEETK